MALHSDPRDALSVPPFGTGDLAPRNAPDGVLNAADLVVLMRIVEGLDSPSLAESTAGDLTGDGVVDLRDVLALTKALGF